MRGTAVNFKTEINLTEGVDLVLCKWRSGWWLTDWLLNWNYPGVECCGTANGPGRDAE